MTVSNFVKFRRKKNTYHKANNKKARSKIPQSCGTLLWAPHFGAILAEPEMKIK